MSKIIDRTGKGAAIDQGEFDGNYDSLHGINQVIAGATHTVDITDQGDTLEFTNAGAVAVTLDSIATIQGAAHTSDFHITLIATNAATVATITPNVANSFNTGVATIVLTVDEYVTLETDSTGLVWNIIGSSDASQVGGLSASQFLRSDANDTATGDLTFSGNVGLDSTWDIGGTAVTKTAAEINDLVEKSSTQTISGLKTFSANVTIDKAIPRLSLQCTDEATENALFQYLDELGNQRALLWRPAGTGSVRLDARNSSEIVQAELELTETGDVSVVTGTFKATSAELTTPALTNATGSLNGVTGSLTSPALNTSVSGTALETTITNTDTKVPTSGAVFDKVAGLNTKVIDIGDWNMDANASVNVAHGLTLSRIRSIKATIRNDADSRYDDLAGNVNLGGTLQNFIYAQSLNVSLSRITGGVFDSVAYDATTFNRGWITIQYTD